MRIHRQRGIARVTLALCMPLLVVACDSEPPATQSASSVGATTAAPATPSNAAPATQQRWYDTARVTRGAEIYNANCATCHGDRGQGSFTWRQPGADGKLPPPPLNGTAHAWHHPIGALAYQIRNGAPGGQGAMPTFGDKLNDEQLADVIAYFQDFWSDDIYSRWLQVEAKSRQQQ